MCFMSGVSWSDHDELRPFQAERGGQPLLSHPVGFDFDLTTRSFQRRPRYAFWSRQKPSIFISQWVSVKWISHLVSFAQFVHYVCYCWPFWWIKKPIENVLVYNRPSVANRMKSARRPTHRTIDSIIERKFAMHNCIFLSIIMRFTFWKQFQILWLKTN